MTSRARGGGGVLKFVTECDKGGRGGTEICDVTFDPILMKF